MKASILKAINDISSMEEMNEVIDLIKMKQKSLRNAASRDIKASVRAGDDVVVKGRKANGIGTILEVKRTKAIVLINNERWNVPLTLIEKA
jgi:hypothetical protein